MSEQIIKRDSVLENIEIIDLTVNNKGIARIGKNVVFVDNTIPGDQVKIQIRKKKKGIFEASVLEYQMLSKKRQTPICEHFGACGGCKIQNMKYDEQLLLKQKFVEDSLTRIAKLKSLPIENILGSEKTEYYRNKLEYSFSNKRWLSDDEIKNKDEIVNRNALGFHAPGRFDRIIDINKCFLQDDSSNQIRNKLREFALENNYSFYDPIEQKGLLRNVIVRTTSLGDLMIIMVFGDTTQKEISKTMSFLSDSFEEITSLYYLINTKPNDSTYDLDPVFYNGKPHIREQIEHIEVLLGPKSFYQTNSTQAVQLYNIVKDFADIQAEDIVYDLYSGVGSIGLFLSKDAKK